MYLQTCYNYYNFILIKYKNTNLTVFLSYFHFLSQLTFFENGNRNIKNMYDIVYIKDIS